jgi:indole-3-glycerol phosphate synthase
MGLLGEILFIAEAKDKTPFDHQWKPAESCEERLELAIEHGDWISIHTDERWGGSFKLLARVRELTSKPLLAKGYHATDDDIERALDAGADRVLTVRESMPEVHADICLAEPLTLMGLGRLAGAERAVWNARNPYTGDAKIDDFEQARLVRPDGLMYQASHIRTVDDVHPSANGVLVGTHLPEFIRSLGYGL